MKKRVVTYIFLFFITITNSVANDGGFYIDGNQLIPMLETDISVKKEILTINRSIKNPEQAEVIVYYEFYNPGEEKTMTVGFEAASPSGDAQILPVNGKHPYLHEFTVEMNSRFLPYQIAIVGDSLYYKNGKFRTLTQQQIEADVDDCGECGAFRYVYHFDASFKKGLNIIKHTYTCDFSTFVGSHYVFGYVLSAAMRWGNHQIDDFTLNINMGEKQLLNIDPSFFKDVSEWIILGIGKSHITKHTWSLEPTAQFFIQKGYLTFQAKNFKPKGELNFYSPRDFFDSNFFDYKKDKYLPYKINLYLSEDGRMTAADDMSKKILRNLPFAWRGYVFSTPELKDYYEKQIWYYPDINYKAEIDSLSEDERIWIEYWRR